MKQYLDLQGTEILVGKILEKVDKQLLIDYVSQQVDIIEEDANGHDYIEINGVKWATMNVGASNPEDTGLYFQWGDTLGYSAELIENLEKAFLASDYKFNPSGDNLTFTKYNSTDGKVILDLEDDPVHAAWGGTWRMPTIEEFKSLLLFTPCSSTAKNQKAVLEFYDPTSEPTKRLYFPYCGYVTNSNIVKLSEQSYIYSGGGSSFLVSNFYSLYLSSSLNKYNIDESCGLSFYTSHGPKISYLEMCKRFYGIPVRGVLGSTRSPKYASKTDLTAKADKSEMSVVTGTGNDTDKATITLKSGTSAVVLTSHQDISGKANVSDLSTVATSGSYNDLSNKPTIPTVPTNVSTFTNDANYVTQDTLDDILGVDVNGLVQIKEVLSDDDTTTGLINLIGQKADAADIQTITNQEIALLFDPYRGHAYVEIAGLKWATMNIGAESITDGGLYFAWGDTQGYTADQVGSNEGQKEFTWADYKYGNGTSNPGTAGMTKYNSTDNKTVLDLDDDAVNAAWGGNWRMPTAAEFQALGEATTSTWTDDYQGSGVSGVILTDKTDSSKKLFFPAYGCVYFGAADFVGSNGNYWGSSLDSSGVTSASLSEFYNSDVDWGSSHYRYNGSPVRGVAD